MLLTAKNAFFVNSEREIVILKSSNYKISTFRNYISQ